MNVLDLYFIVQLADQPSRTVSHTESMTRRRYLPYIREMGCNLDMFATPENQICTNFISQYSYTTQRCRDALEYQLAPTDVPYLYPPSCLVYATIREIFSQSRKAILLLHDFIGADASLSAAYELSEFRFLIGE